MHEITVFSCGDSRSLSTWSNVPYLFTKTLEEKGIRVNRINISPNKVLNRIFNTLSYKIFKRCLRLRTCPEFHRTWMHRYIIYRRIKKATKQYPHSELNLFLSFAFFNPYSDKPNVLWCDWTDAVVIERLGREPMWYERASLRHETKVMRKADLVYTMFPKCKEQMEKMYGRKIRYLNRNVVNTVYKGIFDIDEVIANRMKSNKILFVGNLLYKDSALQLISATALLREKNLQLECHIIGMTEKQLLGERTKPEWVRCYGYLHKDIEEECNLYYQLILDARMIVNISSRWAGYSSIVEAMYYGCPVIVSPFDDFVAEFGLQIGFGVYCHEDDLAQQIFRVLHAEYYVDLCHSAHKHVKTYTWSNYVGEFLESVTQNTES